MITDSGVITVTGTADFTTDVDDKSITLDSSNAITGAVTFTTQTTGGTNGADITLNNGSTTIDLSAFTTEGNLTLQTNAAIAVAGHTVNGDLSVTSSGAITQSAALTVTGTSSFTTDTANQSITLSTTTNSFAGAVSASTSGTGDVTIDNGITALNLGTVTAGQNLSARAGEAITDSGVITVGGTSTFITDANDKSITLDSSHALTGAITFTTQTGGSNLANIALNNGLTGINLAAFVTEGNLSLQTTAAIAVAGHTVNGNLAVTSGGAITQSAALTVTGTSSFSSSGTDQPITLDNTSNALTGAVTFATSGTGGDVTFDNGSTGIDLAEHASGVLDGDLTLTTTGATTLSNKVTLDGGALTVDVAGGFSLNVSNALTATSITLDADDDIIFTDTGNLSATSGNIIVRADSDGTNDAGSGGAIIMTSGTSFNSGSGTILLSADENITLGALSSSSTSDTAISLTSISGNVVDAKSNTSESFNINATSGTVVVSTAGDFGESSNTIEIEKGTSTNFTAVSGSTFFVFITTITNNSSATIVISPYWQSDAESYTFIAVSHTSLSGMASQIGLTIHTLQSDSSSTFATAQSFTIDSGTTKRVFIVRTNHPNLNKANFPGAEFIVGTKNFAHGHIRVNSVATRPNTLTGVNGDTGDGFRDITMLSFWGTVVTEQVTTGFAMEFIGDMKDSQAASANAGSADILQAVGPASR